MLSGGKEYRVVPIEDEFTKSSVSPVIKSKFPSLLLIKSARSKKLEDLKDENEENNDGSTINKPNVSFVSPQV